MSASQISTLGDAVRATGGSIQTGPFGSQLHASDYVVDGTPLVMPVNIGDNVINERDIARVGSDDVKRLARHRLRAGDIVFGRRGEIGRRSIVRDQQSGWLCGTGCLAVKFGNNLVDVSPEFVALYVGARAQQNWLIERAVGGTMPNLNTQILSDLPLELPHRSEQDSVVHALDDVMATERLLRKSIAKRRAIKQGMMQELLTGRTRLPGFTGEWSTRRLSTLGTFLRGSGIKRDQVRRSGVPCIRYGEIYTTFDDYTASTVSFVDPAVAATSLPLASGDILFAGSGETKSEIGMNVAYIGEVPAVAGGDIIVLRGTDLDPVYLATLLNTPEVTTQKARGGQGDAVVHINWRVLAGIEVTIPRLAEQHAIAQVLIDADAEIAALERRLDATRAIKQGMMQELLTGRTRLPVKEDAA